MQALSQAARPGEEDKVRRFGATCAVSRGYSLAEAAWALVEKSRAAQDLAAHAERLGLSGPRQYFVVDVGCWLGRLLYVMEQARFYPRYLGIDANRAHVEEARRLNGGNKRATFYEADLVAWGGCKDAPDAIVCLQCLEHVPKKEALWALRQWVGIVRPRGLVVVGCPVDHRGQRFHDLDRERRMEHRWIPVFEELIEYMEGLGCRTLAADSTYSIGSSFRVPRELPEWLEGARRRMSRAAFRAFYMAGCAEPTGGGYFVWRTPRERGG